MLYIINGGPGTGKTLLMMHILTTQYCKKDRETGIWSTKKHYDEDIPEEKRKPYTIISNINGLKLPHLELDDVIQKSGVGILDFFKESYQKEVAKKYPNMIYIIDECQRYFHAKMHDSDVLYFFESHRHLGIDIYLLAQTYKRINQYIRGLEYKRYVAKNRQQSVFGEFSYTIYADSEKMDQKVLTGKQELFKLYKSRERKSLTKTKNPLKKYLYIAIIFAFLSLIVFYYTFLDTTNYTKEHVETQTQNLKTAKSNILNRYEEEEEEKQIEEENLIKYYYTLDTYCEYDNYTGEKLVKYYDRKNQMFLPIEIIQHPILKIKKGKSLKYIVICNYENAHFKRITQSEESSKFHDEDI